MRKIIVLVLVSAFCLMGYEASAQKQSKNLPLSPKQEKREVREQRRAEKQAEFEKYMDSLILSGTFQFTPQTMQRMPAGSLHLITNPNFNMQYWDGTFDIFLPYVKGYVMPYYMTVLNCTVSNANEYLTQQNSNGWVVTFVSSLFSATTYTFTLEIYAKTGGATLTINAPGYNAVQYSGTISQL